MFRFNIYSIGQIYKSSWILSIVWWNHLFNKLFNTHGAKYRELGLKDKLKDLSDEEKLDLLSSNGMLVKRPLAVLGDKVTVGFKEEQYKETWL